MFPSKFFSTGGDEINANCYAKDASTQNDLCKPFLHMYTRKLLLTDISISGKNVRATLDTFTQATHASVHAAGKRVVVWEEMVLAQNVTLRNDTAVM
jgi:hexosaminidase